MQPEKKQLEILLVHYFRACFDDFPKGKLSPSESPDFVIKMKNRREIGIELTRLNPASRIIPDGNQLAQIQIREQIIGLSQDLFEKTSSLKLFVKFLFSDSKQIPDERQMSAAVQVVNLIRKAVSGKNRESFFRLAIKSELLPEGLDEILVINHPVMEISAWERANNLGVSNDVVTDIRLSIHKKDEKLLRLYQKQRLNFYWLLITTDRLHGLKSFNLPEKIRNHEFHSEFQHVFLFDLIKPGIFQLV
jgi:hypothetical protein